MMSTRRLVPATLCALALAGGGALAQTESTAPDWAQTLIKDPKSPEAEAYRLQQARRAKVEQELKRLRLDYFRQARPREVRGQGIEKLKTYADPAVFPSLVEIFAGEGSDVCRGLVEHFAAQRSEEGDTTLAWMGVFGREEDTRKLASRTLVERLTGQAVPERVKLVLCAGLERGSVSAVDSAAGLAGTLKILELIPWLIMAQGGRPPAPGGGGIGIEDRTGALAYIFVGTQRTYVSNLTPVVAEGAVGFQPTVDVANEGSLLVVGDASVTTVMRPIVHSSLVGLTSAEWGRSTDYLGYDPRRWNEWYAKEFRPFLARREAAKAAGEEKK